MSPSRSKDWFAKCCETLRHEIEKWKDEFLHPFPSVWSLNFCSPVRYRICLKNPSHSTHCQLWGSCHGGCLAALLDDAPLSSTTSSCIETCIIRPQVISFAKYIRFYPFNTFTHLLLKAQEYLILFFLSLCLYHFFMVFFFGVAVFSNR